MASELRVNTLKDASGNNSVGMSTVSNGTAKMFLNCDQGGTHDIADSFNVSSLADDGLGRTHASLTNAHSNANYANVHAIHTSSNRRIFSSGNTASIVKYQCFQESTYTSQADSSGLCGTTHGDLA
tara:strand:+ start:189 stop:566 length:378 start_codon:yes stop_codon:yes gene_type:complete